MPRQQGVMSAYQLMGHTHTGVGQGGQLSYIQALTDRPVIDVRECGAVEGGIVDCTAAFNLAVATVRPEIGANDRAGGIIDVPQGNWLILGTVAGRPGVVFRGQGNYFLIPPAASKVTWINHQPTVGNTDCFVFDLSAWDTYGRAANCGLTDMYISGNANSRRLVSYPNGLISPIFERVWTHGGSVGLYCRYGIESNFYDSTFESARDFGVCFDFVTAHSTSINFWGCHIWGQLGTTDIGLYVDGAITFHWYGGVIDECATKLVEGGTTRNSEVFFHGTHFETDEVSTHIIHFGQYAPSQSVITLDNVQVQYTFANLTNQEAVTGDNVTMKFINSILGVGYACSATANTGHIYIDSGCVWGNAWAIEGVRACATPAEWVKVIGNNYTKAPGGYAGYFEDTPTELTIVAGVIAVTKNYHIVDGEGGAADTLSTINGGIDGMKLTLQIKNDARNITVDEAGNVVLTGANCVLDFQVHKIYLLYDGTNSVWVERGRCIG